MDLSGNARDIPMEIMVITITIGMTFSNSSTAEPYVSFLIVLSKRYNEYKPVMPMKALSNGLFISKSGKNGSIARMIEKTFFDENLYRANELRIIHR
jgi:hypothetical protein